MIAKCFDDLLQHVGHVIECVYGYGEDGDAWSIAIECVECEVVLLSFDNPKKLAGDPKPDESYAEIWDRRAKIVKAEQPTVPKIYKEKEDEVAEDSKA